MLIQLELQEAMMSYESLGASRSTEFAETEQSMMSWLCCVVALLRKISCMRQQAGRGTQHVAVS